MKYKLLALDLDGTTLNNSSEVSAQNRLWIGQAVKAGVIVIFATGRGFQTSSRFRESLALTDAPMVFLNGAEVWANKTDLLSKRFMEQSVNQGLYELARKIKAWFWLYTADGIVTREEFKEDMLKEPWVKFGIQHKDPAIIQQLFGVLHAWGNLEVTQSAATNVEVGAPGVTKASGVLEICNHLGLTMKDVMAIGDSLNDYSLIVSAGLGVAMNNADLRLKAVADTITETNENDGVAKAIQRYLLG